MKSIRINSVQPKIKSFVLAFLALFMLSSCASLVSKNEYDVYFDTNPIKGNLTILDKKNRVIFEGNTPVTVKLPSYYSFFSKAEYLIKFSAEGYQNKVVPLRAKVDGWYWGNILFGGAGVIGWLIIDPATGSMYKIDETVVLETLRPGVSSASFQIINLKDLPASYHDALAKIDELEKVEK